MTFSRLLAFLALVSLAFASPAQAQTTSSFSSSNAYQFGGTPGSFGYSNAGSTTLFQAGFQSTGGLSILGCGGIGAFSFMNTTFNMNSMITQLTQYMETMLAKQLLIQAMSIPQVAAIFDTLNALGNARFSLFNQSCNLGQIQKEAKQKIIKACIDKHGGDASISQSDRQTCQSDFDKDASINQFISTTFKNICGFEAFNQAARPAACRDANGNTTTTCSFMAFMPQVRLNLSGGVGGKNTSAMCQTNSNVYGAHSAVLPLQATSDIMRNISDIFISKPQAQIDSFRAQGGTYAQARAALDKVDALCAAKDPRCTSVAATKVADLYNPASPGFIHLAQIDYKPAAFAQLVTTTGSGDAFVDYFKNTHGISDSAPDPNNDPLMRAKLLAQILAQDDPNIAVASPDFTTADITNFTSSLKLPASGDANAGADAQGATSLMQIAVTWVLAKEVKIDQDKMTELEYKAGPSCAMALRNGLGVEVTHLAQLEIYNARKAYALQLQSAINSKQVNPVDGNGNPVPPPVGNPTPGTDTQMGDATQKAYAATMQAAMHGWDDDIAKETRAYSGMQDWAKKVADSDACKVKNDNAAGEDDLGF